MLIIDIAEGRGTQLCKILKIMYEAAGCFSNAYYIEKGYCLSRLQILTDRKGEHRT